MKQLHAYLCAAVLISCLATSANAAKVMYLLGNDLDPSEGSQAIIELLEDRGDELDLWGNDLLSSDPDGAFDAAEAADVIFIDESISSSRADVIFDTETPVINNEQYAFDNWLMVDLPVGHGSPSRPDANGDLLNGGSSFGTSIEIVDPNHPIALGAGASGIVQIYDEIGGRIDWGRPGEDAIIVAQLPGFDVDLQPASPIFIYEKGSELIDGSTAPGMRIGFFLSDTNRGPEPEDPEEPDGGSDNSWEGKEGTLLTDMGKALINATFDYALGISRSIPGDFNSDSLLDIEDINLLVNASASREDNPTYDLNGDNAVNDLDVTHWVTELKNTWLGDANLDGEFNSSDFVLVFGAAKYEKNEPANWDEGDWNGDGVFSSGDFVAAFGGAGYEKGTRPAAVPEPNSLVLIAFGLFALAARRR
ncbi:MAG: PEP-CTERM sorting domain-containing protein [Planctomycetales bacterium]|nr:PEP-CTERM sorting domain-containing protein [Planctomycetales bacterium]